MNTPPQNAAFPEPFWEDHSAIEHFVVLMLSLLSLSIEAWRVYLNIIPGLSSASWEDDSPSETC